jgi:putative restriction endonuclease
MKKWGRQELIVAFNLYCQFPFGKIHSRNPDIVQIAKQLDRSPSSLAMKMLNFASLDPMIINSGRHGLGNASNADRAVWQEFHKDWGKMAYESEQLLAELTGNKTPDTKYFDDDIPVVGKEREALVRIRVNQSFFRAAVLASYDYRCCITGLSISELLNASHIIPWSVDSDNRINPKNGLCLNVIHDRAFDRGLLTITPDYKVKISPSVKIHPEDNAAITFVQKFDNACIRLPERFRPDVDFLKYHNENIFIEKISKQRRRYGTGPYK